MSTIDLTAENFSETIQGDGIVFVDWWASWCGPCVRFAPVYEAAAEEHSDVTFAKVDTEAQQELAGSFAIQSIPTLMVFRDGIMLFSQPGALPAEALEDLIGQAKAIDMDDVRRQMDEQPKQAEQDEHAS